jgi:Domain of unknown function (DUF4340)
VATPLGRARILPIAIAVAATGFLAAMALSGHLPRGGSLVPFQAAGVLPEPAEGIDRVELGTGARRTSFARVAPGRWVSASGDALPDPPASRLDMALRFMHVSAPIRVMTESEYAPQAMSEFGLDPPRYTVTLERQGRSVMVAAFGARNPQDVAQYVRVAGRTEVYLLPSFVGREWEALLDAAPDG